MPKLNAKPSPRTPPAKDLNQSVHQSVRDTFAPDPFTRQTQSRKTDDLRPIWENFIRTVNALTHETRFAREAPPHMWQQIWRWFDRVEIEALELIRLKQRGKLVSLVQREFLVCKNAIQRWRNEQVFQG